MKATIIVAVAIGIVLAVAGYFYTKRVKSVATGNSIAVLPFVNARDPRFEQLMKRVGI